MPFQDRPLPANFEVSSIIQHKTKRTPPRKPKGAIAKITRDLKEGIIDAAVIVGSDGEGTGGLTGFLVDLALHHKKAYAGLLAKILPLQISPHYNAGAMIGSVNIISVPTGSHFSAAELQRIEQGQGTLDVMPQLEQLDEPARFQEEPAAVEAMPAEPTVLEEDDDSMPIAELMRRANATRVV